MPAPAGPTILGREPLAIGGSNTVSSYQFPVVMGKQIWQWSKGKYPFSSMVIKFNSVPIPQMSGHHLEDKPMSDWAMWTGADETAGSEATTVDSKITNWDRMNVKDLWINTRTEEVFYMSEVSASDALTAVRGGSIGSHTAPMKNGDVLMRVSNQNAEGSEARDSMATVKERVSWSMGLFRDAVEMTTETAATEFYGGAGAGGRSEEAYQLVKLEDFHKKQLNNHCIFGPIGGDYATNLSATYGHRIADGMFGLIKTNLWNCNGSLTWDQLKGFVMGIQHYAKGPLMLLTSSKVIDIITSYGNDYIQITPNQNWWGWEFDELRIGGVKIALHREELFDMDPYFSGMGVIASPKHVVWHPFSGNGINQSTKLVRNIKKENNVHKIKHEMETTGGWEFFIEPAFGRFYGA